MTNIFRQAINWVESEFTAEEQAVKAVQEQQEEIDDLRDQIHLAPRHCNLFCRTREFWEGL